jgi:hypothetical protein
MRGTRFLTLAGALTGLWVSGCAAPAALTGATATSTYIAKGPTHPIEPTRPAAPSPPPPPSGPTFPTEPKPGRPR